VPIRPWKSTPRDKNLSDNTNDFLAWVMTALSEVQGSPTPPPAPTVSLTVSGNAVTLTWNEIAGSAGYIIYENTTAVVPPKSVAIVQSLGSQAVKSGLANSYRFTGLATGTFYYFVQAITANGVAGGISTVQKAVVTASGSPPAGAASVNDHFVLWQTDLELINRYVLPFGLVMGEGDGVLPHAIPAGVTGQVLISNGPGVDPAFADPIVSGATAIGAAPSTNPVFVATWDGTNIRVPLTINTVPGVSDYGLVVRPIGGFAVTVTSGTVTSNQGTNPWIVAGNLTNNNAAPGTAHIGALVARANAAAPSLTEGNEVLLSTDLTGNLRVVTSGSSGGGVTSSTRTDTFTTAGNGVTVDVSANPLTKFSVQVTGTGAVATTWDVRLEGSLDNVNFTQILQHTNVTGDTKVLFNGAALAPTRFFRSRVAGLVLGGATNIVVAILGVQ